MRVALCFSGMPRTFDECLPTIVEHVIRANPQHEFHTFMSIWLERGRNAVWWECTKDMERADLNKIVEMHELGLKSLRVDTYMKSDFMLRVDQMVREGGKYHPTKECNPANFIPMLKKMEQAHWMLIENANNGVHYDCVVKLRTDLKFTGPMVFKEPQPNTIYMPEHECWGPAPGYNDQFLYGNGDVMSTHCSMFYKLDELFVACGRNLHPETLLDYYYKSAGFTIEKQPIPYKILR